MDRDMLACRQDRDHIAAPELDLELSVFMPAVLALAAVLMALFFLFMRPQHCRNRPLEPDR